MIENLVLECSQLIETPAPAISKPAPFEFKLSIEPLANVITLSSIYKFCVLTFVVFPSTTKSPNILRFPPVTSIADFKDCV